MTEPVSELHAMLVKVGREFHAARLNRIANDPSVLPTVKGYLKGPLDLGGAVANNNNILLMGQHGGILFVMLQPGLYEAHTSVLPAGRGKWALDFARACVFWMFTKSDALELLTRCPQGNIPALALTKRMGAKFWFRREDGWVKDNDPIPADIYRMTIHDWLDDAPGLVERGRWFRDQNKLPQLSELNDRIIGFAAECLMSGQTGKAVVFANRYASIAGLAPIKVVSTTPLAVNIGGVMIVARENGFYPLTQVAEVSRGLH